MKVLITGAAGKIGRIVSASLASKGHDVLGIDRRPWNDMPEGCRIIQTDIRKRAAEDVFRTERPDAVIHMATVAQLKMRNEERSRINLGGTRAIFDYCHRYGVGQAIFVGRHTYYGAAADSPLYHTEDEPPMALDTFPELADLVAADLYAGSALWRFPEIHTCVLRICYTLGPQAQGTLAAYLAGSRVPMVLGFDPLFQFMHEADVARAIELTIEKRLRGVYNVSGPPPLPLSIVIQEAGRSPVPVPEPVLRAVIGRFGMPNLAPGARNHIKYPIVIDSNAFRKATGFEHAYDEYETLRQFRTASPAT
ncbi:MAG: SDR family oxidoreductase [Polyangiales bacterium]|nr:SDR family oxidoreductase [Myxococcales bacterium]